MAGLKAFWLACLVVATSVCAGSAPARVSRLSPRGFNAAYLSTCAQIAKNVSSSSEVTYFLNPTYTLESSHYMSSSSQLPACVFTPASAQDISNAIKIIGQTKTPFAVQCGGHASNPGFSSTTGVHISMANFKQTSLSADKTLFTMGLGQVWDNVYAALDGSGVNIVGGRVPGVGAGGFTLGGGGYSWLTNSHGLTIDSVASFQVVLPNGTITTASATNNTDLFFALRGGGNKFGVVTSMTLRTVPQPAQVYGGIAIYPAGTNNALSNATAIFSAQNKDPNAQIITTFNTFFGIPASIVLYFYNAATAPASTFSMFNGIPTLIDQRKTRSFADFVQGTPANVSLYSRGAFHTVSLLELSPPVMAAIVNQTEYYGNTAIFNSGVMVSYDVEPFLSTLYDSSQGGAYPHTSANPYLPLNLYFSWELPSEDTFWQNEMKKSAQIITDVAIANGQAIGNSILYPNYALADTPLNRLFGSTNLARLQAIKASIDPNSVMDLAGGFKF